MISQLIREGETNKEKKNKTNKHRKKNQQESNSL